MKISSARFIRSLLRCIAALTLLALLGGCGLWPKPKAKPGKVGGPLKTVSYVDLPRFMGDWRVIASIPAMGEKGHVDAIISYALRPDGTIESWQTFRKKSFDAPQKTLQAEAEVVDRTTNAEWRVKALGFGERYFIIDLDPNYQWAVIGHPSRKAGWILARERTLPEWTYEAITDRLAIRGYDPSRFEKVRQVPEQIIGQD